MSLVRLLLFLSRHSHLVPVADVVDLVSVHHPGIRGGPVLLHLLRVVRGGCSWVVKKKFGGEVLRELVFYLVTSSLVTHESHELIWKDTHPYVRKYKDLLDIHSKIPTVLTFSDKVV